jgi:hypothetical protein
LYACRNPQCQGLVERANRTYKDSRMVFLTEAALDGTTFDEHVFLSTHVTNENKTLIRLYGTSPFLLLRGHAPSTSVEGSRLDAFQLATIRRRCAEKQVRRAKQIYDSKSKKCARAITLFNIGDVVLVAATDQQMRKKEAKRGRWGAVARILGFNPLDRNFYSVRFITQGPLTRDKKGTVSVRFIFGLQLKAAPQRYTDDANIADARAAEQARAAEGSESEEEWEGDASSSSDENAPLRKRTHTSKQSHPDPYVTPLPTKQSRQRRFLPPATPVISSPDGSGSESEDASEYLPLNTATKRTHHPDPNATPLPTIPSRPLPATPVVSGPDNSDEVSEDASDYLPLNTATERPAHPDPDVTSVPTNPSNTRRFVPPATPVRSGPDGSDPAPDVADLDCLPMHTATKRPVHRPPRQQPRKDILPNRPVPSWLSGVGGHSATPTDHEHAAWVADAAEAFAATLPAVSLSSSDDALEGSGPLLNMHCFAGGIPWALSQPAPGNTWDPGVQGFQQRTDRRVARQARRTAKADAKAKANARAPAPSPAPQVEDALGATIIGSFVDPSATEAIPGEVWYTHTPTSATL